MPNTTPAAVQFKVTRTADKNVHAVIINGAQVGTITKEIREEDRPVPGTTLRFAKGLTVTRYFVKLDPARFVDAPRWAGTDTVGARSLKSAKYDIADRLTRLTLR